jgi:YidC/Oxa1 family membrane protein insertase
MTDIRRTLLWVVFSMSLVLLWDAWNKHNGQPSMFAPPPPAVAAKASAAGGTTPTASTASGAAAVAAASTDASAPLASQKIDVETPLMRATIDTRGGDLVRVELLQHQEHLPRPWYAAFVALFKKDEQQAAKAPNVVVFDQSSARKYMAQTGLIRAAGGAALPSHTTVMTGTVQTADAGNGAKTTEVRLESPEVGGAKLVKIYTFHPDSYVVDVRHEVVNSSSAPIEPQLYLQLVRDGNALPGESSMYSTFTGPAIYTEADRFKKIDFKDIEKGKHEHAKQADDGWVAMVQHYFASAWLLGAQSPAPKQAREFFTRKIATNEYSVGMIVPLGAVAAGQSRVQEARLFVGPQEENKLSALAPGLESLKDYGIFAILSKPLFWLLSKLHNFIGNWGWSIVALVVLLKIAFYWLNASAYRSMAKMKAVNPRIMEMRERLKDKPQQLQQEMLRIYREEKVNPLGGCLPIVVQMPFFIALYWVLLSTVEMRNAPWIGWVHDLSVPDPYFILPLLMTATSLLQTWLNPRPPDPVQAKMMWFMPLIFSVMFFFFPAGLVLYWLTNNILSIAQQWLINKQMGVLHTP